MMHEAAAHSPLFWNKSFDFKNKKRRKRDEGSRLLPGFFFLLSVARRRHRHASASVYKHSTSG
jgi:hypothetical protein